MHANGFHLIDVVVAADVVYIFIFRLLYMRRRKKKRQVREFKQRKTGAHRKRLFHFIYYFNVGNGVRADAEWQCETNAVYSYYKDIIVCSIFLVKGNCETFKKVL